MGAKKSIEIQAQLVIFKECDERKQDNADKERIGDIRRDGIALRPACEGPESLERRADQKTDAQLCDPACGKEYP